MNKTLIISFIAISTIVIMGNCSNSQNPPKDTEVENNGSKETIQLFNGHDFEGWYTFLQDRGVDNDPKSVFTVQNEMIRISGEEWGCITTNNEYENYHLITEFKWGEITFEPRLNNARDCGILLHSQGEDGSSGGIWINSIECQIIEGGTGDFIVVGDGSDKFKISCTVSQETQENSFVFNPEGNVKTVNEGRINWFGRDPEWKDTIGFRGKQDVEKEVGEWNTLECIAEDDQITIILNGVLVNKAKDVSPKKGRIQIQSEGAEIFFRRIELRPITN